MYSGFEEGAATFRFSHFKKCQKALVRPYDRYEAFIEQCANGEESEEEKLLMLDELFKQGRLDANQILDALQQDAS